MEVLPETEIKPTEMEIVPASDDGCDASEISDPLAEEKEEFDNNTYQHDEVGLNPIEDIEILEKILKQQNHGCCDTAVEGSLKRMNIPEEMIEKILCKADKTLCTCETTDWMQKATGYNYCGTDDSIAVEEDDGKSAAESNLESVVIDKGESIADDAKTEAETDLDTSAETEDVNISFDETKLDTSAETDGAVQAASVAEESNVDASVVKDESVAPPVTEDAVEEPEVAEDTALVKEEVVAVEDVAVVEEEEAPVEEEAPAEEIPVEEPAKEDAAVATAAVAVEAPEVVDECNVDTPLAKEEENTPF